MKGFFSSLFSFGASGLALAVLTMSPVSRAESPAPPAEATACPVSEAAFRDEFEKTKETPSKETLRAAAVYLIYATEGEPQRLATLVNDTTKTATKQALERATNKYIKLLTDKTLSPIAREYVENLYFAIGNRRGVPKVMIMEKIAYGSDAQRAFRDHYMKALREENETRKIQQEVKAAEDAKREAAEASEGQ